MSLPNFKDNKKSFVDQKKSRFPKYIYTLMIVLVIWVVFYLSSSRFISALETFGKNIKEKFISKATTVVSETIWDVAKTDINGNVNVLLVWVGGKWHQWAYNTDTLIVASFSPSHKTLTFLSVPRDLWVKISNVYAGRINAVLDYHLWKTKDINLALGSLRDKISEIVGLDIPYYAMVDFGGFKKAIDILGGLPINVPETLDDPTYPDDNERADQWWWGVNHLVIASGYQVMDWDTALKYARSRHSTSDFDRSARQQAVISAVIDRLVSTNGLANIGNLYNQFKESVETNLTNKEIFWLAKYVNDIWRKDSFTMPSDCIETIKNMTPWCLLYSPDRAWFNWAAVLLQEWATAKSVSNYTSIQKFASIIFWLPNATHTNIYIANAVDKKFAAKHGWNNGIWNLVWAILKKYWLNVIWSMNSDNKLSQNYIVTLWTWDQSETIAAIQKFVTWQVITLDYLESLWTWDLMTWAITAWDTWFSKFDTLRQEMTDDSGQDLTWSISTGQDIYDIKSIDQLHNLTWWVLVVIWNQYLLDN